MIVVLHPTGNRNVRAVLTGLHDAGLLAEFSTTLAFRSSSVWLDFLPTGLRKELLRRSYDIPHSLVHTRPWREAVRLFIEQRLLRGLTTRETGWTSINAVYRDLDKHVARRLPGLKGLRGVYAYEYGAYNSFAQAEQSGLKRFYDLPIAYHQVTQRLIEEEATRFPQWAVTLTGRLDDAEMIALKDDELRRADVVFCPSRFVADSLPAWVRTSKDVFVAPFGSPVNTENVKRIHAGRDRKLRVLFAGSMSQRKGLGDLFAAMHRLRQTEIELVVMGSPLAPMEFYRREYPDFVHEPTRPHAEVLRLMRSCDVLVLPSLVEGRALVMQEAMSQGLPILITANTGGEDLVESGRTGFLVPIRSPEAIAERLAWFAGHREETRAMGEAARAKAATYTWADYGATIVAAIERHLAQPHQSHHGCQIS